jgi:uncharacterized protein (TIGR02466 family)
VEQGAKSQANIQQLFATPLVSMIVPDADSLNSALLGEIAVRRAAEDSVARSNIAGWHSASDFFARTEPAHARLAEVIREATWTATRLTGAANKFAAINVALDGWINVNPGGAYNSPHDHPGAYWSGCYYVRVPAGEPPEGAIEFLDPRTAPVGNGVVGSGQWPGYFRVVPKAGEILIFPSTVRHWVHPHRAEEERVTIAFNARFSPVAAVRRKR